MLLCKPFPSFSIDKQKAIELANFLLNIYIILNVKLILCRDQKNLKFCLHFSFHNSTYEC